MLLVSDDALETGKPVIIGIGADWHGLSALIVEALHCQHILQGDIRVPLPSGARKFKLFTSENSFVELVINWEEIPTKRAIANVLLEVIQKGENSHE